MKSVAAKTARAGSSSAAGVAATPDRQAVSPNHPEGDSPSAAGGAGAAMPQGAGKRLLLPETAEVAVKRAKVRASSPKGDDRRAKGAKRSDRPSLVEVPPLAATDTEAAELAFHTISDQLVMPNQYTPSSQGSNRRLAGTASQLFFGAQIGFSQIILLNDRLSKTVDDNAVEIANLKKSAEEGRAALMEELRPQIEKTIEERLAQKDKALLDEKEVSKAVRTEKDRLQEELLRSGEIEKTLLEEQDVLRKKVEELRLEKTALLATHEAEVTAARAEAGAAYLQSAEFIAQDKAKYKAVVGNVVAAVRHLFREECPDIGWDSDRVWDAIGQWSSSDVNSEAHESEEEEAEGGEAAAEGGDATSGGSPRI
ncbi:unnamed protein product [Linum trigynum]|uniref:Uncharacterized protein n=1 Tax=Linum trigynum TaxID=586398 RepID=A0AAV2EA54_9ROSI